MKKTYFPHDSNARNDYKLIKLRSKYNYEGFGIYFALLELLFSENNKLRIDDFETLAFGLQCDSAILKDIIQNFDLFEFEDDFFYSKRLSKTLDDICQKSLKASENAKKRWNNATAMRSHKEQICDINASKVNESKVKKSKSNDILLRLEAFQKKVFNIKDIDLEDKKAFIDYWSETNKSASKMRFEMEKTWDLGRRIKRWVNNGFNKDKNKMPDYFDEVLYKKMDMSSKKEYEKKLKQNGFSYSYNPNSGGKWIKKAGV
jgi:uncharacterized protein YdaU (DUF1376 family)